MRDMCRMSLDVIIPVFNPKTGFNAVLDAVCKQTLTPGYNNTYVDNSA